MEGTAVAMMMMFGAIAGLIGGIILGALFSWALALDRTSKLKSSLIATAVTIVVVFVLDRTVASKVVYVSDAIQVACPLWFTYTALATITCIQWLVFLVSVLKRIVLE
jgi:uncharacterized membrane protein (UPF0136 family)